MSSCFEDLKSVELTPAALRDALKEVYEELALAAADPREVWRMRLIGKKLRSVARYTDIFTRSQKES